MLMMHKIFMSHLSKQSNGRPAIHSEQGTLNRSSTGVDEVENLLVVLSSIRMNEGKATCKKELETRWDTGVVSV